MKKIQKNDKYYPAIDTCKISENDPEAIREKFYFYSTFSNPTASYLFDETSNINQLRHCRSITFSMYADEENFMDAITRILYTDECIETQSRQCQAKWKFLNDEYKDFQPGMIDFVDPQEDTRYFSEIWHTLLIEHTTKPAFEIYVRMLHHEKKELDRIFYELYSKKKEQEWPARFKNLERMDIIQFRNLMIECLVSPTMNIKKIRSKSEFEENMENFASKYSPDN